MVKCFKKTFIKIPYHKNFLKEGISQQQSYLHWTFFRYETALIEYSNLSEAKEAKNWELALQRLRDIVEKLKTLLTNEEVR